MAMLNAVTMPDDHIVYVTNEPEGKAADYVSVINTTTNTVTETKPRKLLEAALKVWL